MTFTEEFLYSCNQSRRCCVNLQHYKIALEMHLKLYFHKFKIEPLCIYALCLCYKFVPLPFSTVYSYTINDSSCCINKQTIQYNTFWLIFAQLSPFLGKIEFTKHYIFAINLSRGLETLPELVTFEPSGLVSHLVLVTFLPVSLFIVYLQPGPCMSLITPLDQSGLLVLS